MEFCIMAFRFARFSRLRGEYPRQFWLMFFGMLLSTIGSSMVWPFLMIYVTTRLNLPLTTAASLMTLNAAVTLASSFIAGPIIDRVGPRLTLTVGLVMQAIGFGLFPLVRHPWHAFVLIAVEGAGSAGFWPSQSTLMSRLVGDARRHAAFALQRATMNLGIGLGGVVGGLIASVERPQSFTVLFAVDAVTFLGYIGAVAFIPEGPSERTDDSAPSTYAAVLRHRTFMALWTLNFVFVAAGIAMFNLLPPFVRDHAAVSEREIGFFFLVNTLVIVLVQLPLAHWIEGRRRMRALALMPVMFAVSWLLVDGVGYWLTATTAFLVLLVAAAILGVAECFHGPAHIALVADIGPPHLRGRYFAVHSLSWGLAGTVGPALGGWILDRRPFALWPLAAAVCLVAAGVALTLDRLLPERLRRVPSAELPAVGGGLAAGADG
jgi:MFS family permease